MRTLLTACLLCLGSLTVSAQEASDEMWKLANAGKVEEAIGLAEEFVSEHPGDPMGLHNLGRFFLMAGEHELAVETLTECLAQGPEPAWALAWTHCALGEAHAHRGELELAKEHLQKAVDLDATKNCTQKARRILMQLSGEDSWGKGPMLGSDLPDFELHGLLGESYGLESFADTAVLLRFGTTW